jgi:hypothetical protein
MIEKPYSVMFKPLLSDGGFGKQLTNSSSTSRVAYQGNVLLNVDVLKSQALSFSSFKLRGFTVYTIPSAVLER